LKTVLVESSGDFRKSRGEVILRQRHCMKLSALNYTKKVLVLNTQFLLLNMLKERIHANLFTYVKIIKIVVLSVLNFTDNMRKKEGA
jgi:hypothetical protein